MRGINVSGYNAESKRPLIKEVLYWAKVLCDAGYGHIKFVPEGINDIETPELVIREDANVRLRGENE